MNYSKLGTLEREKKKDKTKERLKQLKTKLETFFKKQKEALEEDVQKHADSLKEYLQKRESVNAVCKYVVCLFTKIYHMSAAACHWFTDICCRLLEAQYAPATDI